jgi:ribosome-binding factor A
MPNPRSLARLAARIHARAAHCLEFELRDPRSTFITITRVEVSKDAGHARIHYSVLGDAGERSKAEHMLASAAGYIQKQVARVLETRIVPRLSFHYDDSIERAAGLSQAIQAALDRDRAINPFAHREDEPAAAQANDTAESGEQTDTELTERELDGDESESGESDDSDETDETDDVRTADDADKGADAPPSQDR